MTGLKGLNAVITGSTSGIGLGIARGLAESGMNVVINGMESAEEKQAISKQIEADSGVKAPVIDADLTMGAEARGLIEHSERFFHGL
jgi:3-hydroxybutyrate dehydrogenase